MITSQNNKQTLNNTASNGISDFGSDPKELSRNRKLGVRARERREELGLTQKELGQISNINKNTIQGYEAGKYPKGDYVIRLAKALKCSIDWLLTGKNYTVEDGEFLVSTSKPDLEMDMSDDNLSFIIGLMREKIENLTNENKALRDEVSCFKDLKKKSSSAA